MQTAAKPQTPPDEPGDLFFKCESCGAPLVVDRAAAGLTLKCERCGEPTTVPHPSAEHNGTILATTTKTSERLAELHRHLKENESQRTEINGYINQLSIQLHRWQIRIQTLDARNKELTDSIEGLASAGDLQPQS